MNSPFDTTRIPPQRRAAGATGEPARVIVARNVADLLAVARSKLERTTDAEASRRHCQVYWTVYYHLMRKED